MISILEELISGINEVTGLQCYSELPDGSFQLPMIVISERNNDADSVAFSGSVEVTKLTYEITIYSNNVNDIFELQEFIDSYFKTEIKRFKGSAGNIQQRHPIYYRTLTYTGKVKQQDDKLYIL